MRRFDVLIAGGGQAGAQAALTLRKARFSGSIAIASAEPNAPYDRPPLTKEYLLGDKPFEAMLFRSAQGWAELGVELLLEAPVAHVDAESRAVDLAGGARIGYGDMIWAAGGEPRRLTCTGADLANVYVIRARADVDALRRSLETAESAIVVGGGYVGLEAAAALIKLGKRVTLIEGEPRVLARVAAEPISRFFETAHRKRGVDVRLGTTVAEILGEFGAAVGVRLTDGGIVRGDVVIVGVGITPCVGPLAAAGAICGNGVRVDEQCRTSLPNVFAAGDCAEQRNPYAEGAWVRIESVQNANDQAATAACCIAGVAPPRPATPWFWSHQFDLKLQTVGLAQGYDGVVVRGASESGSFSTIYLKQGRVIALDCVNAARDYSHGRALIASRAFVDAAHLADVATPLKALC